jgi:hypothetical protein
MIAIATLSRVVCTPSPHSGALGDSASSARFQKVFEYRVLDEILLVFIRLQDGIHPFC